MIKNIKDKETQKVFNGKRSSKIPDILQEMARKKLFLLNAATSLEDMRNPPGNHFKALEGRHGYYSIRINTQWRITFSWNDGAGDVKIEDYH